MIAVQGSGPDLVLLHGWGMSQAVWGEFGQELNRYFTVHRVDLPGYGSDPFPGARSPEEFVQKLSDQLPQAIWCGWSLGGQLAMLAALRHPKKVRNLVLLSAGASFIQRPHWTAGTDITLLQGFRDALQKDAQKTRRRFAALNVAGSVDANKTLRSMEPGLDQPLDDAALIQGLDWLADIDLSAELGNVNVPGIAIYGSADRVVSPANVQQTTHQLSGVSMFEIADAGHAAFVSHPDEILSLIRRHIIKGVAA